MKRKPPVTKDPERQKRIIEAAQAQCDKIGLGTEFSFNENGEILIDGMTADDIDRSYDMAMKRFYEDNAQYLDPYQTRIHEELERAARPRNVIDLPAVLGPEFHNPRPHVLKFEEKKKRG